jgi:putative CocE/NonD family hydrolase
LAVDRQRYRKVLDTRADATQLWLLFVACLLATWLPLSSLADAASTYDDYVRESLYVPVRDGTRLALNIYRPAVNGVAVDEPFPVVFAFTPYRARFYNEQDEIVELGQSARLGLTGLTNFGYVVATADIRGKGASFGHRRGFQDRTEAKDGYDLVQWLAGQPWSSGAVGITGCSYLGGSAIQVATTAPPALKAVFAGASDFDKYAFVRRGGLTAQFNTRPDEPPEVDLKSVPVDADPDGKLLREAVAQHAANTPMAALWYGMPYRDSESSYTGNKFWLEVGPYTYRDTLQKSGIAFYLWGNWSDEPTEQIIIAAANLKAKMLVGPGSHCAPSGEIDMSLLLRRFFDHHLKGVDNGVDHEPAYTWRLQNAPDDRHWITSDKLPGVDVDRTAFFVAAAGDRESGNNSGKLAETSPAAEFTEMFQVDFKVGEQEYFSFWPTPDTERGLSYQTPVLAMDQTMTGFPVADIWISADREDVNVFAYIDDVAPDGSAEVVSFGRLMASHRKTQTAPYNVFDLPWHSGLSGDTEPLKKNAAARLRFSMLPNAWVFKAGHKIRMRIAGADPRQRNLAEIATDPAPVITIHSNMDRPSAIYLPLVADEAS